MNERDSRNEPPAPATWPPVVAVVPARNEADVIQHSVASLLAQDYAGDFRVILVDDQSDDGTGDLARALNSGKLTVLSGAPRPPGWTGKLWAMKQGGDHAAGFSPIFSGSPMPTSPITPTIFPGWWRGRKAATRCWCR